MASHRPEDRERAAVAVGGASELLDAFGDRLSEGMPVGVAAARSLAAGDVDWRVARDQVTGSERAIILAEVPDGPVLAAKYLAPGRPTAIHDHGAAGAAIVVEGRERYERFERTGEAEVRLESIHDLAAGDVTWWGDPPDDVHRQSGLGDGAIGLVVLAASLGEPSSFADVTPTSSDLRAGVVAAFLAGDTSRLEPWYDEGVFVDANIPGWRFQARGRPAFLEIVEHEEFSKADRRLTFLRATDTSDGLLLETELRYTDAGALRVCRETHHVRIRRSLVVEHVVWCTGVADAETARNQFETASIERA